MPATVEDLVKAARAQINEIDLAQAKRLHADQVPFIDVREAGECAKGTIPGALEMPRGVLEWKVGAASTLANRTAAVVVYCQGGGRSALCAVALEKMGFTNVYSFAGGYGVWSAED
jgi:sulfur dioxygenase